MPGTQAHNEQNRHCFALEYWEPPYKPLREDTHFPGAAVASSCPVVRNGHLGTGEGYSVLWGGVGDSEGESKETEFSSPPFPPPLLWAVALN